MRVPVDGPTISTPAWETRSLILLRFSTSITLPVTAIATALSNGWDNQSAAYRATLSSSEFR